MISGMLLSNVYKYKVLYKQSLPHAVRAVLGSKSYIQVLAEETPSPVTVQNCCNSEWPYTACCGTYRILFIGLFVCFSVMDTVTI